MSVEIAGSGSNPSDRLGDRSFSLAVISDTHLNQGESESNSPFEANRLANGRMRHVIGELNARDLDFVVHLGDLVHPVPAIPHLYGQAARRFHEQVAELVHPLHLVPGNHDVGDKPIDWGPAGAVTEQYLSLWKEHFGEQFHSFDHRDCHFAVINAQIINSGLPSEDRQRGWLERDLATNAGRRVFLFTHYPPFLCEPDESEHYDNIAEPGRSWLLGLLEEYRVEALFAGHVHNFWFHRHGETDCYLLPSTAFVRHDYLEVLRTAPEPGTEAGRNDTGKLGYFVVHVHQGGHVCEVVRTFGKVSEPGSPAGPAIERVAPAPPRRNPNACLGFDMRQAWAEVVEIPPSGSLDEFSRKKARNDYPLMALWEMGIRKLRVPFADLARRDVRERMAALRDHGHRFTLFTLGPPEPREIDIVCRHHRLVDAWEIGFAVSNAEALARAIGGVREETGIPIYLSRLWTKEGQGAGGGKYHHVINHGFSVDDEESIADLRERHGLGKVMDGLVFRVACDAAPWPAVIRIGDLAARLGLGASVHLRMGASSLAEAIQDDPWAANRLAEAMAAAMTRPDVTVYCDTFADVDRGYFVRNGVVDRRYNPRLGFYVVRHLYGALSTGSARLAAAGQGAFEGGRYVVLDGQAESHVLVLPDRESPSTGLPLPERFDTGRRTVRWTDLASGEITEVVWRKDGKGKAGIFDRRVPPNPVLITCT